ncbi:MAG: hypothetical protein CMF22_11205 [Idiomarinaceae bacterium]|nr:hypothetical protein [Idiomarinaceae bacterium]|tara:strand:+ start:144695 stop:145513 length:819 start_codon:yes stop_codon:yes gene_type:complete
MKNQKLKAVFESDLLTDETKAVVQEAFDSAVEAKVEAARVEMQEELKESIANLSKDSFGMIQEAIAEEMKEVAEELAEARTIEVRYSQKFHDFKEEYAAKQAELNEAAIAEAVKAEIDELREDIEVAKRHQFSMEMFEAFKGMFQESFGVEDDASVRESLQEARAELDAIKREQKINELLSPLSESKRAVAMTILEGVELDKLEARAEAILPLINKSTETEAPVVESAGTETAVEPKGTVVMESEEEVEDKPVRQIDESVMSSLERSIRRSR